MKTFLSAVCIAAFLSFSVAAVSAEESAKPKAGNNVGEQLFKQHCAMCHPDGGNIVNAQKTLHAKALKANNITKPEDIVKVMRKPGPGMTPFDAKTIPDKEAMEIARYILKTFK